MKGQLTLWSGEAPAKPSLSPEEERASWIREVGSCSSTSELFERFVRAGCSGKTSLEFYRSREEMLSRRSKGSWSNAGIRSRGELLMLSSSEWPSDAAVCSLSDILIWDAPQRYSLSAKACAGTLRRAERGGRALPPELDAILRART